MAPRINTRYMEKINVLTVLDLRPIVEIIPIANASSLRPRVGFEFHPGQDSQLVDGEAY